MSAASRRFYRKLLLGVAALGALVWVVVDQFDIEWATMLELFLAVLLACGLIMLVAAVAAGVWMGLRRLGRRAGRD